MRESEGMRILLVKPDLSNRSIGSGRLNVIEPLELETLAANLPNHDVEILDMRFERDLSCKLSEFDPDVVGATAYTVHVKRAKRILRTAKRMNRDILTLIGGIHATVLPEDFNEAYIDAVVIGEGVDTIREIVDCFEKSGQLRDISGLALQRDGQLHYTSPRDAPPNLDGYPLPNRSLTRKYRENYCFGWWRPVTAVRTSFGCPFRCKFCATPAICKGNYISRSARSIAGELLKVSGDYVFFAKRLSQIRSTAIQCLNTVVD